MERESEDQATIRFLGSLGPPSRKKDYLIWILVLLVVGWMLYSCATGEPL